MKNKGVSVVVAVYHAGDLLSRLIDNLRAQDEFLLNENLEILLVYGDQNEDLTQFENLLGVRLLYNANKDPMSAKYMGFRDSKFEYVSFIDQDEKLVDATSLKRKVALFEEFQNLLIIFPTGYLNQIENGYPNVYTSEYGDPYNFYFFKIRNNHFRAQHLSAKLGLTDKGTFYINHSEITKMDSVLLESSSMSVMIAKARLEEIFRTDELQRESLPMLSYLISKSGIPNALAILKDDLVEHCSSANWRIIHSKIKWRVNNTLSVAGSEETVSAGIVARKLSTDTSISPIREFLRKLLYFAKNVWYILRLLLFLPVALRTMVIIYQQRQIAFVWHLILEYSVPYYVVSAIVTKLKTSIVSFFHKH
jgi:hypothetical protein